MKSEMERMEREREDERAEIEAQIERALASMHVGELDFSDSDLEEEPASRPTSRMSSRSDTRGRARSSDAASRRADPEASPATHKTDRETGTIEEGEEEEDPATGKPKRFSASGDQDLRAVDEGINQKSDKIAKKVQEIQEKVCMSCLSPPIFD